MQSILAVFGCEGVNFLLPLLVSWKTVETEVRYKRCGYAAREQLPSNVPSSNIYHIMMDYLWDGLATSVDSV